MLVGRTEQLNELAGALSRAAAGRLSIALIEGEAGIGKTRLVQELLRSTAPGRVLGAGGAEPEANMPFALADQLVRGAGGAGVLAPRVDDVTVALCLLERLEALAGDPPAVVVIDDAQWVDAGSMSALVFALRRLTSAGLLVLLVARTGEGEPLPEALAKIAGAVTVRVGALGEDDLRSVAAGAGVRLSSFAARRLHAHTRGNPLHLLSLLSELPAGALEDPDAELGAPHAFAARVERRVARLPGPAAELVRVASVLGQRVPLTAIAALLPAGDALPALDAAVAAELLRAGGQPAMVAFAHPMIRAVVYGGLGPGYRARVHLAAAEALQSADERLRHRAAAATTFDEGLAADLEACAHGEGERGRWAAARALFLQASRLSPRAADRDRRFLAAADALLSAGDVTAFDALSDRICTLPAGPRRGYVEAHRASLSGDPERAGALLARVWDEADGDEVAAATAYRLALHHARQLRAEDAIGWARRAASLGHVRAPEPLAMGLVLAGDTAGALEALADGEGFQALRGRLRLLADDVAGALAELSAADAPAWLAAAEHAAGLWDDAERHAQQAGTACPAALVLALDRGRLEAASDLAQALAAQAGASECHAVRAVEARARVAAARGQWPGVLAGLASLAARPLSDPVNASGLFGWAEVYASALLSTGRLDEADAFLQAHEGLVDRGSALVRLARLRGRIGAGVEVLSGALELAERLAMPYEVALTQLAYGQRLRRAGQRRAAVRQLEDARACLARLGARPALERCERELVASGLEPVKRRARDDSRLTPQEEAVSALAGAGLTNREIAAELVLSVKTVEVHLTRVYAKLGIRSRRQLRSRPQARAGDLGIRRRGT